MSDDNDVRFTARMPEKLREDAKAKAHGDLSEEIRDLFKEIAYGPGATDTESEVEKKRQELGELRTEIDNLRHDRAKIETKIEAKETRAARLEEQIASLEEERDQRKTVLETLENMLHDGERIHPRRIEAAADVDHSTAKELHETLQDRNPDVPDTAFRENTMRSVPDNWKEATDQ